MELSTEKFILSKWEEAFRQLSGERGVDGLQSFVQAWDIAVSVLQPRPLGEVIPSPTAAQASAAFDRIHSAKMTQSLIDHFVRDLEDSKHYLQKEVSTGMALYEVSHNIHDFVALVDRLHDWYTHWYPNPQSSTLLKAYRMTFHKLLCSALPTSFPKAFNALLDESILYTAQNNSKLFSKLEYLGLLDRFESLISGVVYRQIERKVGESCPKDWYISHLTSLRSWLREVIVPWLAAPYARGAKSEEEARVMVSGIVSRFDFYICRTLCDLRIHEIFDMIVDYQDSQKMEALNDLKECLARVDRRQELIKSIRKANNKRLLHPGADTKDILNIYVSTIKCLRIIDPPGVLLFKVANPIRQYLRGRDDTIRNIVASLVGDSGELADENEQIQPLQSSAEDYSDRNWEPEPIDAGPDFRCNKHSDVVSTLVSIYDSKDLFVKELQHLLAQRLLAVRDGNFDRERRNVEILKLRFGDAALQVCEVMLKDMTDSRRLDQHIQSQEKTVVHCSVISRHFWPSLLMSKIQFSGQLHELREKYCKSYAAFKPDKRLNWLPLLGELELEIELKDRKLTVHANPLQAAVIDAFSTKETMVIQDLRDTLDISDAAVILTALRFWVDQEVLVEISRGTYRVLEEAPTLQNLTSRRPELQNVLEEEESAVLSAAEDKTAEKMNMYWQYIRGMLTNLGPQPVQKIHSMLRIAPNYDQSLDQLLDILEAAKREGWLVAQDSTWRLSS